jgi:hypothetical protein
MARPVRTVLSRRSRAASVAAALLVVVACAKRPAAESPAKPAAPPRPVVPAAETSGFLDDYSRLVPGGPDQPTFVYRNPDARMDQYHAILFEPVTIWRSGKQSLADIPPADLKRLAFELQHAVRVRLERGFTLVKTPGPGVLRIRLGLTQARQDDPIVDVFTYQVMPTALPPDKTPLAPATRAFANAAALEGELTDASTGALVAIGVDRRRTRTFETWGDLRAASERWATWFESRLERARDGR